MKDKLLEEAGDRHLHIAKQPLGKKEWLVKITFTNPQEKEYLSELEESDDIEKIEVVE